MKTQYFTATSLDGYIAGENNSLDWLLQFGAEDPSYEEFIKDIGAIVMGSSTYEWVLDNHVFPDPAAPKPWPYDQPTWVFTSRTLRNIPDTDIRFVKGDVGPVHAAMRDVAGDKNIWVVGGGDLAGQFHVQGLLDEMIITIAPVILTRGAPLFTQRITKPPLRVVKVTPHAEGLIQIRMEVPR